MTNFYDRRDFLKAGTAAGLFSLGSLGFAQQQNQQNQQDQPEQDQADSDVQDVLLGQMSDGNQYVLPDLPYAYDALEPQYSEQVLRIHHTRHHQSYVDGLNQTIENITQLRQQGEYDPALLRSYQKDIAFHGGGHILHSLFWNSMTPDGVEMPEELTWHIRENFGSPEEFYTYFSEVNKSVRSSAWGMLGYEPIAQRLVVLRIREHQDHYFPGVVPLLICDAWEHAYYLQYENNRGQWVDNFMQIANWEYADQRLRTIRQQLGHE